MMKLKVDVHCEKCMKKVNKVLCKFPGVCLFSTSLQINFVPIKTNVATTNFDAFDHHVTKLRKGYQRKLNFIE